jgi:mRNA interferase RelE/StbE
MDVRFDKSFLKSLEKYNDINLLEKIEKVISNCESAGSLKEINNLKKLSGFKNFYRIKIGSFRIGFELIDKSIIRFIIFTHRKDIYKKFP